MRKFCRFKLMYEWDKMDVDALVESGFVTQKDVRAAEGGHLQYMKKVFLATKRYTGGDDSLQFSGVRYALLCDLLGQFQDNPSIEALDRLVNWAHYHGVLFTGGTKEFAPLTLEMAEKLSAVKTVKELLPHVSSEVKPLVGEHRTLLEQATTRH